MKPCSRMTVATAAAILAMTFALAGASACFADERPNVLFVSIDDLNDWIGCLGGHPQARTPNFDRLADRGVIFTCAHCAVPACNPSRTAIMTGVSAATSGIYYNNQYYRTSPVLKDVDLMPLYFIKNGYTSIASGKMHQPKFPEPSAWDTYVPSAEKQVFDGAGWEKPLNLSGMDKGHFDWGPLDDVTDQDMPDYKTVDYVISQLNATHDKPFFLACGIVTPHIPFYVPRKYIDARPLDEVMLPEAPDDDLADLPPTSIKWADPDGDHATVIAHGQWKNAVQGFLASVDYTDMLIGRLIDALDASPYRDNTIVVIWSDHGMNLGEKKHWRKYALWEDTTRVPLIIRAPGVTDAGGKCGRPVNLLDIFPTLAELCRLPKRPEWEGHSLVPLLRDPAAAWPYPSITTYGCNNHSIRTEKYRYIRYATGDEELYDHDADPNEWHNLASDPAYKSVKVELAAMLPRVNAPDPGEPDAGHPIAEALAIAAAVILAGLMGTSRRRRVKPVRTPPAE